MTRLLRTGRFGVRIPVGARFSATRFFALALVPKQTAAYWVAGPTVDDLRSSIAEVQESVKL